MVRTDALKLKVQLFCGDEPAIGPGKAQLLEAIGREGSISAAGRALGMSYRRTWMLVDTMNRSWKEKLVETTSGGGPSKGARLTACGRTVLEAYRSLERQLAKAAAEGGLDALTALLLNTPRETGEAPRAPRATAATD
ncbi:LysR family transcriptional regulator [Sphingomonadaceae bacterium jetA1]|jgi:molybdate transport system regulatory protein|uniref:winged helix-turn-helix domain-containing protein n=1 Tax=Facivitalis istanbulensis TaxID=3075838 RepID=UPI003473BB71